MNTIMVTGNTGYIGNVLAELLENKSYKVTGYDVDYYRGCDLIMPYKPSRQIIKDIRDVELDDLKDIDAVIHLAALCNDPLGELNPSITEDINFRATVKLAQFAKEIGIKRFIYSSSQSMYGIADTNVEVDEDNSEKNPITMYAKTKWLSELELKNINSRNFIVTCMRPSTVFGVSPRFRCDIVFNNLVANAFATGKIEIKSDGTPWRPVVHVRDVSNAFIAALEAPEHLVAGQSFNIGIPNGNFRVRDLAEAAQRAVPDSTIIYTGEHGSDERTYRVSFTKILTVLKGYYKPEWDLDRGGIELVDFFRRINFTEEQFTGRLANRLKQINYLMKEQQINNNLRWEGTFGK